ncbi:MAG: phosphoglycerate kinase [Candidatus Peregrinibacteria bacterium]|nr:phosphoglycerate kinase [Candidatus Peregrinibacteria bacterium]
MKISKLEPAVVKDKVVVIRVDFNVPLDNGKITETTRIESSIPTLKFLIDNGAKSIHILTHVGRPKGKIVPELSTKVLVSTIEKFLGEKVEYREDFTKGDSLIQLHENVRYWPGETKNDPEFTQLILDGIKPDIFVNDGFAVSHRPHSSVVGVASFVPAYPGVVVESEIKNLSPFLSNEKIPGLTIVVAGAKMETKVGVLRHFAKTAENVLVGGALANTFLAAEGFDVGASLYEESELDNARDVLGLMEQHNTGFHLPIDVICADDINSSETLDMPVEDVTGDAKIFDIGAHSIKSYCEILQHSKVIMWNGPVGCFEKKPFENGTREILKIVSAQKSAKTILGGGDTLDALKKFGVSRDAFSHVSTGGGAMLEFLEGKLLPGIEVLLEN